MGLFNTKGHRAGNAAVEVITKGSAQVPKKDQKATLNYLGKAGVQAEVNGQTISKKKD